jgi:uncharacterized protein
MLMPDVNILIYAHRKDAKCHAPSAKWLQTLVEGAEPFALSALVAVGFVRTVTNRRIYEDPTPLTIALRFIEQMTSHPRYRTAVPSEAHLAKCSDYVGRHRQPASWSPTLSTPLLLYRKGVLG